MRDQAEYRLQCAIVQLLKLKARPGVLWFAVPNGEHRTARTGARLKRMGVRAGVFDLAFVLPRGRAAFLELKGPRGKLSESQHQFLLDCEFAGALTATAASFDEAEKILVGWGVL